MMPKPLLSLLTSTPGRAPSPEVAGGVVLDLDADGRPVGIVLQRASRSLDLSTLETTSLPPRSLEVG